MNENEARDKLARFLTSISSDTNHPPPKNWTEARPVAHRLSEGQWLFTFDAKPNAQGVVVSETSEPVPFWGALGKAVQHLGLPRTRELFLCSTVHGRYQLYENGIAVWEAGPDVGYPIPCDASDLQQGRDTTSISAFFDLRGFTSWSIKPGQTPAKIQHIVKILEEAFQEAFSKAWCHKLFVKGTGDGLMVVSEAGWCRDREAISEGLQKGHAVLFTASCANLIAKAREQLPVELAVGCGITIGAITRVFLLGRHDYIGPAINEAAKIQQLGWNEICVSKEFYRALRKEIDQIEGHMLAEKGWRLNPEKYLEKFNESELYGAMNS